MTGEPQLQALADLCRGAFLTSCEPGSRGRVLEPEQLAALARRHRVQGLCWKSLGQQGQSLREDARAIAEQGLRTAALSHDLLARFERGGVRLLFLKGQAVGKLAYGDPLLKLSSDLDVLILPTDLEAASTLLFEMGYRSAVPSGSVDLLEWHRRSKESAWVHAASPPIELHSRVADHPGVLPELDACAPYQTVDIGFGVSLPTFVAEDQFAYLAVHGASSAWFRLKWLADFAALLVQSPEAELERLCRHAVQRGAGRAPALALLLAKRVFGIDLGTSFTADLRQDRGVRLLEALSLRQLCSDCEPTERPLGTLGIHASQLLLLPEWRFLISDGIRQLRDMTGQR